MDSPCKEVCRWRSQGGSLMAQSSVSAPSAQLSTSICGEAHGSADGGAVFSEPSDKPSWAKPVCARDAKARDEPRAARTILPKNAGVSNWTLPLSETRHRAYLARSLTSARSLSQWRGWGVIRPPSIVLAEPTPPNLLSHDSSEVSMVRHQKERRASGSRCAR